MQDGLSNTLGRLPQASTTCIPNMRLINDNDGSREGDSTKVDDHPDLLGWLRKKITDAEKTLKTREDMAATWRTGTNAEWASAGAMHPSTIGRTPSKASRLKEAQTHDRIAAKLRHELTMFRAVLAALSPSINP